MYLINDQVKFRDKAGIYRITGIDDENRKIPRYKVTSEAGKEYSFWVPPEDLEYVPEAF